MECIIDIYNSTFENLFTNSKGGAMMISQGNLTISKS